MQRAIIKFTKYNDQDMCRNIMTHERQQLILEARGCHGRLSPQMALSSARYLGEHPPTPSSSPNPVTQAEKGRAGLPHPSPHKRAGVSGYFRYFTVLAASDVKYGKKGAQPGREGRAEPVRLRPGCLKAPVGSLCTTLVSCFSFLSSFLFL